MSADAHPGSTRPFGIGDPPSGIHVTTAVIADAQPLVLEGLSQLLRSCDIEVTGRCQSGADLLQIVPARRPHLLVLDIRIGRPDGLDVVRALADRGIDVPVVFLAEQFADHELLESVRLGVRGLISKTAPLTQLGDCVRSVLAGGSQLDHAAIGRALSAALEREVALRELGKRLTPREIEILQLTAAGKRVSETAAACCISVGTVKVHLHHIYDKLQVRGRASLVALARHRGWI